MLSVGPATVVYRACLLVERIARTKVKVKVKVQLLTYRRKRKITYEYHRTQDSTDKTSPVLLRCFHLAVVLFSCFLAFHLPKSNAISRRARRYSCTWQRLKEQGQLTGHSPSCSARTRENERFESTPQWGSAAWQLAQQWNWQWTSPRSLVPPRL